MATPAKKPASKAEEILGVGQRLLQTRGYDGFSFRDVADEVGIKSASVHYHFPSKADLTLAITSEYRATFETAVQGLDNQEINPFERLRKYAKVFQTTLVEDERMCLCGMLASEAASLPDVVRQEIQKFFAEQQLWISQTIEQGQAEGEINESIESTQFARMFLSALEGAMVMAWNIGQPEEINIVAEQLMTLLEPRH